jgi:hypothetical protein
MKLICLFWVLIFIQDETPLKPIDEFEVKLNFEFKDRLRTDPNKIDIDQTRREYEKSRRSGPLPYLLVNVKVLKQAPEVERIRIVQNGRNSTINKKFDMNTVLTLDLGFTDDIKDRVSPYEYTIYFLTKDKDPVNKVIIYFEEDGTYIVNGQVRGKI